MSRTPPVQRGTAHDDSQQKKKKVYHNIVTCEACEMNCVYTVMINNN